MSLREWANGLTGAGLVLALGVPIAQTYPDKPIFWSILATTVLIAGGVIFFMRPKEPTSDPHNLAYLRRQTSERDLAFLRVGQHAHYPDHLSELSCAHAPLGDNWAPETALQAKRRSDRLIAWQLMAQRGESEVETTPLGVALLQYDDAIKAERLRGGHSR